MNICLLLVVVESLYPAAGEAQLSHTPSHPARKTKQKDGRSEPCRIAGKGQRVKLDQVTAVCGVQQSGWGQEGAEVQRRQWKARGRAGSQTARTWPPAGSHQTSSRRCH